MAGKIKLAFIPPSINFLFSSTSQCHISILGNWYLIFLAPSTGTANPVDSNEGDRLFFWLAPCCSLHQNHTMSSTLQRSVVVTLLEQVLQLFAGVIHALVCTGLGGPDQKRSSGCCLAFWSDSGDPFLPPVGTPRRAVIVSGNGNLACSGLWRGDRLSSCTVSTDAISQKLRTTKKQTHRRRQALLLWDTT